LSSKSPPLWLLLVIAAFQQALMAGTFIAARYVLKLTDPFAVAFIRFVLAGSVLIAFAYYKSCRPNAIPVSKPDKKKIFILGIIIILFNQTMYLYGQKLTTAAHASLLFAATPIFVYLMAMKHLGEKWSIIKGAGILLAIVGAAVIVFEKGFDFDAGLLEGDVVILVAVVAWGYYTVYGKPLVEKYGAIRITAYALASGALVYFPFGLYRLITADMTQVDVYGWFSIFYIAIITSVIGYSIWYWMLKYMEASRLAVLVNAQPVIAGILGIYMLNEPLTLPFVIGGIIILAGVTITQKG
jgi:drug/metabolite transporter (DMT)-like permease